MTRTKKPKRPNTYQSRVLTMIAHSRLIKTHLSSREVPLWTIDGTGEISHECAQALIRNGWLVPQRDGLAMFDESQVYLARVP